MNIVIFGLTISSSWGNGHATLWRGLVRALTRRGCHVAFFERDVRYYAVNRDFEEIPSGELVLYASWEDIAAGARREVAQADAAIVTSYCPDAIAATNLIVEAQPRVSVFYDLDTPITLAQLSRGSRVSYIGSRQLRDFDLVLSFTGGAALDQLRHRLGARRWNLSTATWTLKYTGRRNRSAATQPTSPIWVRIPGTGSQRCTPCLSLRPPSGQSSAF